MPEARFDVFQAIPARRTSIVHDILLIRRSFMMYPSFNEFMQLSLVTRWPWTCSTGLNVHIELRICGVGRQPKRTIPGADLGLVPSFKDLFDAVRTQTSFDSIAECPWIQASRSTGNPGPGHTRDHGIHGPGAPGRTQVHAGPVSRANSKPWGTWVPGLPGFRLYPGSTT